MEQSIYARTTSRRMFAMAGGIAGASLAVPKANAQTTGGGSSSDLSILNYALTLEHLEATFYTEGLQRFGQSDFNSSITARVLGTGVIAGVYTNLGRIRDHEVQHVETLRGVIRGLGGTPVEPCTYAFNYSNPDQFLQIALTLEETGVMAYDGAIAMLQQAALKRSGASIATVEARHAAYINLLVASVPFPKPFDSAKMMSEVLAMAAPFITACNGQGVGMSTTAVLLPKNLTTISRQIRLDASQSLSANGQPLKYDVKLVSGSAALTQNGTAMPVVQFNGGFGDYTFELTVTDSAGATSTDRTTIRYAGT